ncbi:MAG: glycosyltransferase family 2 protein [Candidatus Cloacimonetes bacterium]|nr:glycosyltransferase family 2 protein [Candidatus Cloacimonadota bacterium]
MKKKGRKMPSNTQSYTHISVVMIVKNESQSIKKCLDSVAWADEIVVLDTGSTDDTPKICSAMGAKVFYLDKWDGFGKARQKAVSLASNDWVFSLDADEIVSPGLQKLILHLQHSGFGDCAYRVKVQSYYLGKRIRYCGWQNEWHTRLFNRQDGNFNSEAVHESIVCSKPICKLPGTLHHYTYPTTAIHKAKMTLYGDLGANKLHSKGKASNPIKALMRGSFTFFKMYFLKAGFLDGRHGFNLCKTTAWGTWYKYMVLWKLKES